MTQFCWGYSWCGRWSLPMMCIICRAEKCLKGWEACTQIPLKYLWSLSSLASWGWGKIRFPLIQCSNCFSFSALNALGRMVIVEGYWLLNWSTETRRNLLKTLKMNWVYSSSLNSQFFMLNFSGPLLLPIKYRALCNKSSVFISVDSLFLV